MRNLSCTECKHYLGGWRCFAFDEEIPKEIQDGEFDHTNPYPKDNGIQFEPRED